MKNIIKLSILFTFVLYACSKEEVNIDSKSTSYTVVMDVNHTQYEGNTKADYQWPDGATLYIKFPDAASTSTARYSAASGAWRITTPQGTLTQDKTSECYISYFEKAPNGEVVELSEKDIIYYDGAASYLLKSDTLSITANLTPRNGRIRFKGEAGTTIRVYGTNHEIRFNTTECNFYYGNSEELELTVNEDGYTPYIHAYFPSGNSDKRLEITDKNNNIFIFKCSDKHLAPGASGYFDIPTESNLGSWKMHTPTRLFKIDGSDVEFKMIFVQWIEGSFYLAETETTQKLYQSIMNKNPSYFKSDTTDLPVTNLSTSDLESFLIKIKEKTGYPFTYPKLGQWWHAAKGGNKSHGYAYSGSDNLDEVAWYQGNTSKYYYDRYNYYYCTKPVKTKLPNELGFYDMTGNVWEAYINRIYSDGSYDFSVLGNSCESSSDDIYTLNRSYITYGYYNNSRSYGFRLCLNI